MHTNEAVKRNFKAAISMLEEAVVNTSEDKWRKKGRLRPAGLALHSIETIEFYFSDLSADKFTWGHRFSVDWETENDEELPTRQDILLYLKEVSEKLNLWLKDKDLFASECHYPWVGESLLHRCLYVLRHTQYNAGQLSGILNEISDKGLEWQI